ncbi:hypothetical protein CspHIS471_0400650 [Cutaneotrichosporon sp. HIS471]|nr:hypothetical protein CspHIS471_0400650 [Cutaneotrichosporon sp. HIS471]
MSRSAPQSKVPSPARSPRVSTADDRPASANKPAGIINMGMTCFLNSTFQSLAATPPLISLLRNNPALPLHLAPDSLLPPAVQTPDATPCLRADSLEPPLYPLIPVTRAFTNMLHKAWTMKDNGGGTSGPGESSMQHAMSLRALLKELARKYDQYDEFAQQDAHELLRHLLDSMEMEEKDVIKRLGKERAAAGAPSVAPQPLPDDPVPTRTGEQPEVELISFVDALFSGLLASVVVCETCKSVSHTYEGFLDLSLSMRGDDDQPARQRKRDRFRGIASRLTPTKGKHLDNSHATMSEPEGSDSEHGRTRHLGIGHGRAPRQPSSDADSAHSNVVSNSSNSTKLGARVRPSFSFRRKDKDKKDKPKAGTSPDKSPSVSPLLETSTRLELAPPVPDSGPPTPPAISPDPSGSSNSLYSNHHHQHHQHHQHHTAAPTAAQAAYIQRILNGPPGPPDSYDPLAKLRAAHAGQASPPRDSGLVESLKNFMAVEVLEGENAFACHKCWKIKVGRYSRGNSDPQTPANDDVPTIAVEGDDTRSGRDVPRNPGVTRAPSPLRQVVQRSESFSPTAPGTASLTVVPSNGGYSVDSLLTSSTADTTAASSVSGLTAFPAPEYDTDGLSDSSESDDEPPPEFVRRSALRPPFSRKQSRSKHFILRRAFKRYLIAKAPEVLVFHIKRFKQTTSAVYSAFTSLKKLDDFVSFPEMLDIAPFMAPNRNDFKAVPTPDGPRAPYQDWPSPEQCPNRTPMPYRLYAVVVHLGTMLGGHYVAYVLVDPERLFTRPGDPPELMDRLTLDGRTEKPDRRVWCYASDTQIRLASVQEVMAARAYLCFYEKAF